MELTSLSNTLENDTLISKKKKSIEKKKTLEQMIQQSLRELIGTILNWICHILAIAVTCD